MNILLCGLPSSGKTTFIAALWYLLFQKEVETELVLERLPERREYLNNLSGKWSRLAPIERTSVDDNKSITIPLIEVKSQKVFELNIPDLSGETWENIWCNRICPQHAATWSQDASGILLFVHCDQIRAPVEIHSQEEDEQDGSEGAEWDPTRSPTQVKLVDLLQSLASPPLTNFKKNIAVVVSAWDKVEDQGLSPEEYISTYLPLLHQFLSNSEKFSEYRIFAISALGGDLDVEQEKRKLEEQEVASKRIRVFEGDKMHNDLTSPLGWLISA